MAGLYDDEWELVNDDGFVYKRKKRRPDPTHVIHHPDPPPPDPAAEQRLREREKRKLKRKILLKLKRKFQKEIDLWENLSNTLKAMEEQSVKDKEMMMDKSEQRHLLQVSNEKCSGSSLVNLVLAQVEQQEAIICGVSRLCNVAEALCDAQEEKTKQTLLDLPVWASPVQLMASLCED